MTSNRFVPVGLLLLAQFASAASLRLFEAVEPHMGTLVRIKLYAQDEAAARIAFEQAFARISALDEALSDYKPASELNRLTRTGVQRPTAVSCELFTVLHAAQTIAGESDGAFDVTVGPVTRLWREARKAGHLPDAPALKAVLVRCGYRKLHLDEKQQTAWLDQPDMQLDLGGLAKGYAADEALAVLQKTGVRSAMVAASGDVRFSDAPPGKDGWTIGIDSFDSADRPFTRTLLLANAAVSTSGASEQHLDAAGKRYSHIIDPHTGMGLTSRLMVTVVAPTGIDADAVATAVTVMGTVRGLHYVEQHATLSALITDGDEAVESSKFRKWISPGGKSLP